MLAADLQTGTVQWRFQTGGGPGNCNNVAAPAVIGNRLHVGTTGGLYYVLDRITGAVIRQLDLREPVFSAPAVGQDRVYVATLGLESWRSRPTENRSGTGTLFAAWSGLRGIGGAVRTG